MTKKTLASLILVGTLLSSGYFGINKISVERNKSSNKLVSQIAEKFNLEKDDVQAVFDAVKDERGYKKGM